MSWTQWITVDVDNPWGGYLFSSISRKSVICHADLQAPRSYAFFCPVCGKVWARAAIRRDEAKAAEPYTVWEIPCRNHYTDSQRVPGSIWLSWDQDFTNSFGEDVLKYELERHLDYAERKLRNGEHRRNDSEDSPTS